ncbi:hypothetical protein NHQ30_002520 [Ciborinia camelliae]|nr:hypothetical protein NHQ30_002520 [Ciborinia camelliae]
MVSNAHRPRLRAHQRAQQPPKRESRSALGPRTPRHAPPRRRPNPNLLSRQHSRLVAPSREPPQEMGSHAGIHEDGGIASNVWDERADS